MGERSKLSQLPGVHQITVPLQVVATGTDKDQPVLQNSYGAPFNVVGAKVVHQAALTGDPTDNMTLSLVNKGTDGLGSDVVASKAYDDAGDDDAAAFVGDDLALSATAADVLVEEDEVLSLNKVEAGTGMPLDAVLVLAVKFDGP